MRTLRRARAGERSSAPPLARVAPEPPELPRVDTTVHSPLTAWPVLAVTVVALVAVQAAFLSTIRADWLMPDAVLLYEPTARNLLEQGTYSVSSAPPYQPTITKMPGYSFFLAGLYTTIGSSPVALRVVQFALVAATALVVAHLGRRLLDPTIGAVAAVFTAANPALGLYAMVPLTETLTTFLLVVHLAAVVSLLGRDRSRGAGATTWVAAGAGASLGALVLVRQTFLFLLPLTVAISAVQAWRAGRGARAPRLRDAAVVAALSVGLVAPWCVRNVVVSDAFVPFGANSGLSLLVSARQYAATGGPSYWPEYLDTVAEELVPIDAELGPPGAAPGVAEGVGGGPQREARLDDALTARGLQEYRAVGVGGVLRGLPERLGALWSPVTRFPVLADFETVLLTLAVAGTILAMRSRRLLALWPAWAVTAAVTMFHVVFHAEPRYTVPARPPLLLLAALAVVTAVRWCRKAPVEDTLR